MASAKMPLPPHLAKAFEQTKMNLHMLYGSGYYSERQFQQIDYWINREEHVWTDGPPQQTLIEEQLMFFDEPESALPAVQASSTTSNPKPVEHAISLKTDMASSAAFRDLTETTDTSDQTPSATSVEPLSDEDLTMQPFAHPQSSSTSLSESSPTEHIELPQPPKPSTPAAGGLPAGITEAQLEEAKAFNLELRRAAASSGSKRKGKKPLASVFEEPQADYASPTPSEQGTQIQSWASAVSRPDLSAPTPLRALAQEFVLEKGRLPRNLNDIVQVNNPEHRSSSRASGISAGTVNNNSIHGGMLIRAQIGQPKMTAMSLEVQVGDEIKVLKLVSGKVFQCQNLRTMKSGQVHVDVLEYRDSSSQRMADLQQVAAQAARHRAPSTSTLRSPGVDGFENSNAAEWDEVAVTPRTRTAAPVPKPKVLNGLSNSRFAVLVDEGPSSSEGDDLQEPTKTNLRDQVSEMVDAKFFEIMTAHQRQSLDNAALSRVPSRAGRRPSKYLVKPVPYQPPPPKMMTCWFWHNQHLNPHRDGCRYSDEDCYNLHHYPRGQADAQFPLKDGKATWAALTDADAVEPGFGKSPFTCWYWATRGHCSNSADECKYVHGRTTGGVAPRPWKAPSRGWRAAGASAGADHWRPSGEDASWEPEEDNTWDPSEMAEDNGNAAPEVASQAMTGWETDEENKPDFVKELEAKVQKEAEALGW